MKLEFAGEEIGQAIRDFVIKKFGYKAEQVGAVEISRGKAKDSVSAECTVETDAPAQPGNAEK